MIRDGFCTPLGAFVIGAAGGLAVLLVVAGLAEAALRIGLRR